MDSDIHEIREVLKVTWTLVRIPKPQIIVFGGFAWARGFTHQRNMVQCVAPCKGIRIPESTNFVLVESGILGFGIRNPALRIRNPTKDWNPESNLLKIHSRLN